MKYTVYKTTNNINNKVYIGVHKTDDVNDNYIGSGNLIKRAIKKYGTEAFTKEILFIFDTASEAFAVEKSLVVISKDTYNLKEGGHGGFDFVNKNNKFQGRDHMVMMSKRDKILMNSDSEYRNNKLLKVSKSMKAKLEANPELKMQYIKHRSFKGRQHSALSKSKISEKLKQLTKDNPMSKPVSVNGQEYKSLAAACKLLQISEETLRKRLRSDKHDTYFYI